MMTLKDIKDWLKQSVTADVWSVNSFDAGVDKTICIRNLTSNRSKIAIGGLENTGTAVKGVSIIVHWNKNPDETERVAQEVHALFYGQIPKINGWQTIMCELRSDEPISLGTNSESVCEYVVELWITYERDRKVI